MKWNVNIKGDYEVDYNNNRFIAEDLTHKMFAAGFTRKTTRTFGKYKIYAITNGRKKSIGMAHTLKQAELMIQRCKPKQNLSYTERNRRTKDTLFYKILLKILYASMGTLGLLFLIMIIQVIFFS